MQAEFFSVLCYRKTNVSDFLFSSSALVVLVLVRAIISTFLRLEAKQNWIICAVLSDRLKTGVDARQLVFMLYFSEICPRLSEVTVRNVKPTHTTNFPPEQRLSQTNLFKIWGDIWSIWHLVYITLLVNHVSKQFVVFGLICIVCRWVKVKGARRSFEEEMIIRRERSSLVDGLINKLSLIQFQPVLRRLYFQ